MRTYGHFCLVARALERVGDRWSLLVIRDLLTGAKRFTDLMDRLGGITPKTLSQRLRELEEDGIVIADREPGRREVWYSLTPAGADLEPGRRCAQRGDYATPGAGPSPVSRCTPSTCSAPPPRPSTSPPTTTNRPAGTSASTATDYLVESDSHRGGSRPRRPPHRPR